MLRTLISVALACSVTALAACTTVLDSSSLWAPGDGRDAGQGMAYSLGKSIFLTKIRVEEKTARIIVCVSDEIQTIDTNHQYVMAFRNSPLSADKISVRTYPGTSILREIDVKSVDQTDQFVINLADSVGAIAGLRKSESALEGDDCTGAGRVNLTSLHMDPGDPEDVRQKVGVINLAIMRYADLQVGRCADRRLPAEQRLPGEACEEYRRIAREFGPGKPPITMKWKRPDIPAGLPVPDCSVGFCYRPRLTNILTIDVAGAQSDSMPFSLTNNSPLMAMDISRGIAITKTTKITFDPMGQPASIYLQKGKNDGTDGAEAVELAKLPAVVISHYFGAVANSIKLTAAALTSQKQLVDTQAKLAKAKADSAARKRENAIDNSASANPTFAMRVSNAVGIPVVPKGAGTGFTDGEPMATPEQGKSSAVEKPAAAPAQKGELDPLLLPQKK